MDGQYNIEEIEKYIHGLMTAEDKVAFELAMQNDVRLSDEVTLYKEMEYLLDEKPIDAFINVLEDTEKKIRDQQDQYTPKISKPIFWFLLIVLLLIPALFLVYSPFKRTIEQRQDVEVKPLEQIIKIEKESTQLPVGKEKKRESKKELLVEPVKAKPKEKQSNQKHVKENEYVPIAMLDLEPNPFFENMIGYSTRSGSASWSWVKKLEDFYKAKSIPISITAKLVTTSQPTLSNLKFFIYNNTPSAYEEERPIIKYELASREIENGFLLSLQKNLLLKPGLYYYLIEDSETEELLLIEKFIVK